ncbi:DUF4097 family beta strand repeat-containing protein [Haloechinothrix salitolerans]|uniref:DUF4097 family beta strand repeat-containing protein n=1 Tax=Haloechinothrix salitolerans TaxID=926830 RepID=A0ABW2BU75_9PSEU
MSRTGRAIAGVVFLGIAVVIATGWWNPSTASADDTINEPVRHVEIDNDSGGISIRAADVDATTVHQEYRYHWGEPDTAFEVRDGILNLDDCGWQCDVSYEVVVPLDTTVDGKVDSGSVDLEGIAEADLKVNSGDVVLTDVDGPVQLDVDSGSVSGTGLVGSLDADVDSGNVELTFVEPPDVTADIDSGNIELTVPDVPYRVTSNVDSGNEEIDVPTDPDSEHLMEFDVDSGNLVIRAG